MSLLSSLSNRIFLASALLTVLSIGVAVFVINRTATARAEEDLERSLEEAGTLVEQFQSLLFEHLVREARLIADLPKLKAAVDTDHEPTTQPLAADYRRQIDADLFLVTNREGKTLGLAEDLGLQAAALAEFDGTRHAMAGRETVAFWPRPEGLLQVVSVPIYLGPEILGTLTAGVSLDRRLATRIKALTRTEVVFGSQGVIHASTLPDVHRAALAPLLTTPGVSTLFVGDEEFVAVRRLLALGPAQRGVPPGSPGTDTGSLGIGAAAPATPQGAGAGEGAAATSGAQPPPASSPGATVGDGADATRAPVAVILRSRTELLRFLRTLHTALALTALAAVIGATVLSFAVARTITRPLGGLIATMREMAATGDLTRGQPPSVPASRWEDEDARVLTSTFRALTASLGRFQHEAAQRERLSSLGRLSTVVAHEIRNPLMIIKASLRTLRRDARHPDANEAISDIEEEVRRLNALVNEVLDYAKPIRFDYGSADVNALCRAAATAASAEQPSPVVRLIEDPQAGEIVTDAERLRLVLINVLTNARDAVLARQAGAETARPVAATVPGAAAAKVAAAAAAATAAAAPGVPSGADVELRTDCPGADTVRITVTDRGQGIPPEHLARIFDPFFTTKRTGSGLGLAIAKNIVEGLGGTIAIASEPSRGTTVRITLPREAPRDRRQAGEA